jgi:hypothetical protein
MRAFLRIIGWSLTGSLIAGAPTFIGIVLYNRLFDPTDAKDIWHWQMFSAIMGGLGASLLGFGLGVVYGILRACKTRESTRVTNGNA